MINYIKLLLRSIIVRFLGNKSNALSDYNNAAETYDKYYSINLSECSNTLMNKIEINPSDCVLDLACGTGFFTHQIIERLDCNGSVTAVDLSSGMLEVNKEKFKHIEGNTNVDFILSNAISYLESCKEEAYDLIVCGWGICYMDHARFSELCYRALKKGGVIAIIENRSDTLKEASVIFKKVLSRNPNALVRHLDISLPKDDRYLSNTFKKSGFNIISTWNGSNSVPVNEAKDVFEYLMKSGASAGFIDSLKSDLLGTIEMEFTKEAQRLSEAELETVLTHRYAGLIGVK